MSSPRVANNPANGVTAWLVRFYRPKTKSQISKKTKNQYQKKIKKKSKTPKDQAKKEQITKSQIGKKPKKTNKKSCFILPKKNKNKLSQTKK